MAKGIEVSMLDTAYFYCGSISYSNSYSRYDSIWSNLDGLDDYDADDVWNERMNYAISQHNIDFFNTTFNGYIKVDTEGDYTFYHKSDSAISSKISINDVVIYNKIYSCNYWYDEDSELVHLNAGYNKLFMIVYGTSRNYYDANRKFYLKYSAPGSTTRLSLDLYYSILYIK